MLGPFKVIGSAHWGATFSLFKVIGSTHQGATLGPIEAIGSMSQEQRWAHSRQSAVSLRCNAGPIQNHRQYVSGAVLGPFEVIGSTHRGATLGPIEAIGSMSPEQR
jgi:hypothetical protein